MLLESSVARVHPAPPPPPYVGRRLGFGSRVSNTFLDMWRPPEVVRPQTRTQAIKVPPHSALIYQELRDRIAGLYFPIAIRGPLAEPDFA